MSDLISRQAAINNIKNGFHWETVNGITAQAVLKQVIHDIEIMPSVQQERKTELYQHMQYVANALIKKGMRMKTIIARTAAVTAEVRMKTDKCCDNCIHYHWYYDYCDRFECEVDAREVHDCFAERKIR